VIAAIYARKSTEQAGADADAKSVARQVENARAFAAARGWTVPDAHVYTDDAISGAETRKLVNRQRLLTALRGQTPPFHVLIMRDASRFSRRDGDEAFGESTLRLRSVQCLRRQCGRDRSQQVRVHRVPQARHQRLREWLAEGRGDARRGGARRAPQVARPGERPAARQRAAPPLRAADRGA